MKDQAQLNPNRFIVIIAVSLGIALTTACGESNTTGPSSVSPDSQMTAPSGVSSLGLAGSTSLTELPQSPPSDCPSFAEVRARAVTRGTDVVVQYALDGPPRDAFYYVRFWPEGRNNGEPVDEVIGRLRKNESASGEFEALSFAELEQETTLRYNINVEFVENRTAYNNGEIDQGHCDRGGKLVLTPRPKTSPDGSCGATAITINKMSVSGFSERRGDVTVGASVDVSQFGGRVEIVWSNMGHQQVVAQAKLGGSCGRIDLEWRTSVAWVAHATFVVRVLDDNGQLVKSRTFRAGSFHRQDPGTWTIN